MDSFSCRDFRTHSAVKILEPIQLKRFLN